MHRSSLTLRRGKAISGARKRGALRELEYREEGKRLDQKLEERWVSMRRALNAGLQSLDSGLIWAIESPWEGQSAGRVCI